MGSKYVKNKKYFPPLKIGCALKEKNLLLGSKFFHFSIDLIGQKLIEQESKHEVTEEVSPGK